MKRILIFVALLPSAAMAQSPGTVENFFVTITVGNDGVPIDAIGPLANDFILTDFINRSGNIVFFDEVAGEVVTRKLELGNGTSFLLAMTTGVRFSAGSSIRITHHNTPSFLVISGYYDTTNAGNVPAIGTLGLVALTLLIVTVGSVLIRKRGVV